MKVNDAAPLDKTDADEYATWFKALSDGTRIQIVSLLAKRREPMKVGDIVEAVSVAQSTVSHHLKILAEAGFVLAQPSGTSTLYQINPSCVTAFPSAADVVVGHPAPPRSC